MDIRKVIILLIMAISSQMIYGQPYNGFLDMYHFNKSFQNKQVKNMDAYQDVEGNPYLKKEFTEGVVKINDTLSVKLQLRYNIYSDQIEYLMNGVVYEVGDPHQLKKVIIGDAVFLYVPFIREKGYVELLVSGKCVLVQKRSVNFKPAEGPKPIEGITKPAEFTSEPDIFYLGSGGAQTNKISSIKSVIEVLQDQKSNIETFIKTGKIKKVSRENLIKIAEYYNRL